MTENKAIIAICAGHTQAEKAIADLQQLGFTRTHLSVFGKAYASDGDVVGCYTSGGHLKARGGSLAFWDRLWNLLGDGGFFLVPNVGPVAIAGSFVRALVTTIDEGVAIGGLSALGAAIYCLGIPRDSILRYEIELRASECAACRGLTRVGSQSEDFVEEGWRIGNHHDCRMPFGKRRQGSSDDPLEAIGGPPCYADNNGGFK